MSPFNSQMSVDELVLWLEDRLPPQEKGFAEISKAFQSIGDKTAFLGALSKSNYQALAETLILFADSLNGANERKLRRGLQHYLVNTEGPIPLFEGEDNFDVFNWAREYAADFGIELELADGGERTLMTIDDRNDKILCEKWGQVEGWSASWSLRKVGQLINHCRFGRPDVISSRFFPFNVSGTGYSKSLAMWMSDLSNLVYLKKDYVIGQLNQKGFTDAIWIEDLNSDTQAVLAKKDECLVLSFRGTAGMKDILTDLKLRKKDFSVEPGEKDFRGKAHRGFLEACDSVWADVLAAVHSNGADLPVFVCGHSLGAAIAQLTAFRLSMKGISVAGVYVFGSPRAGNNDFVDFYNEQPVDGQHRLGDRTFIHINNSDIVPRVPPRFLGYRHCGAAARRFDDSHKFVDSIDEENDLEIEEAGQEKTSRILMEKARETIAQSQEYLKLRDLTAAVTGQTYSATFEGGKVDDHGSAQYLFKFACSLMDDKFDGIE